MSRTLVVAALVFFGLIGLAPLGAMLVSVSASDVAALVDERVLTLVGRTLLLGGASAGLAFAVGLPFGWIVARTDVPGAGWLRAAGLLPLLMPPLVLAMSWTPLSDVRGMPAAILFLAGSTFPLVGLFSGRAFERIDARREEAARLLGGTRAVLRMELPLVLPAALAGTCLAFTFAINDFAVPDYVSSVGPILNVHANEVFFNWRDFANPGAAVTSALPLIGLTLVALMPALALRRRGALATLDGGFVAPTRLALGGWRWAGFAFCFGVVLLAAAIPLGRLLWEASSGSRVWSDAAVVEALGRAEPNADSGVVQLADRLSAVGTIVPIQWRAFWDALGLAFERSRSDLQNSLLWSTQAALLSCGIGLVIGHAIERSRSRAAGRLLEGLAVLPLAAPAILFGIGTVVVWNREATADFYESGAMSVLLYSGRFATFAILIMSGATASLAPSLEEAGALAGAGPIRRLLRIVTPLLGGALAASFVLVFAFSMRELDAAVLVPAANKTVILRLFNGIHFGRDEHVAALTLILVAAIALPGLLWTLFARRRLEVLS